MELESLDKDKFPAEFQKLYQMELKAEIGRKQQERAELQARIQKLTREREDHVAAELKRQAKLGKGDSFDEKVAASIRAQAARKGIEYGKQPRLRRIDKLDRRLQIRMQALLYRAGFGRGFQFGPVGWG
jgi:hypothetical protein